MNHLSLLFPGLLCGCVMGAGVDVADAQDVPQPTAQTLENEFETVGQDFDDLIAREREAILESGGIGDAVLGPDIDPGQEGEVVSLEDLVDFEVQIRGIPVPPSASGSGQQESQQGQTGQQEQTGQQGQTGQQQGQEGQEGEDQGEQGEQVATAGESGGQTGGYQPGSEGTAGENSESIPDGQDDDIVARQLRELAENESDPQLREKLWDEYRKYKAEN